MKNRKLLTMLAMTALAATVFVGCSSSKNAPEEVPSVESPQETDETADTSDATSEETKDEEIKLVDGTYRIEYADANEEGFKTFLEVTVQEGSMTEVTFDEVNEAGEPSTVDDEEDDALEEAFMKATSIEEFEKMIEGKKEAESFKELVAQLMTQMQEGNTDTIVVSAKENQ